MGFFSNFLKRNEEEQNSLPKSSLTMDKELSKLAIDLIGASEDTALISLKSDDLSGEYSRLCRLGLGNSANAKFLEERIRDINAYNRNILRARELLDYIKTMNEFLGDSVILVSKDSFYKLCHKYKLSIGFLDQFTGVIPDANLKEFSDIKYKMDYYSGYVKLYTNQHIVKIQHIYITTVIEVILVFINILMIILILSLILLIYMIWVILKSLKMKNGLKKFL